MKRSDAVRIIEDFLSTCFGGANNPGRHKTADNLLSQLEEAGMKPPGTRMIVENFWTSEEDENEDPS